MSSPAIVIELHPEPTAALVADMHLEIARLRRALGEAWSSRHDLATRRTAYWNATAASRCSIRWRTSWRSGRREVTRREAVRDEEDGPRGSRGPRGFSSAAPGSGSKLRALPWVPVRGA